MTEKDKASILLRELMEVMERFQQEFDVNIATVVGVLEIIKSTIVIELSDQERESAEEDEGYPEDNYGGGEYRDS